jgi:pilus assembly protein CpaF
MANEEPSIPSIEMPVLEVQSDPEIPRPNAGPTLALEAPAMEEVSLPTALDDEDEKTDPGISIPPSPAAEAKPPAPAPAPAVPAPASPPAAAAKPPAPTAPAAPAKKPAAPAVKPAAGPAPKQSVAAGMTPNPTVAPIPPPVVAASRMRIVPGPGRATPAPAPQPAKPAFPKPLPPAPVTPLRGGAAAAVATAPPAPAPAAAPTPNPTVAPIPPTPARPAPRMPEMGPLDVFMKDPTITEIMVNDLRNVMVEKEGKLMFTGFAYQGIDELNRLVRNILDITGRFLSPDAPYVDTMLPDGSRVNIVGPPLTVGGPSLTIRKFPARHLTVNDLMASGALDQRMAYFLNCCVVARMNILICGGTGSGKTTLLNVLSSFIPKGERLVTIEDTPELAITHFNSVRLQTKPQTPASPPVTARELVANALRMRPDRIIVGECRRSEALDMLQAMNTGHSGSMTTLHANSPRDGLSRLETLCLMAGVDLPLTAIRKQIASAIDLIVQIRRFRSGKRRIVAVTEVTGMEGDTITLQDVFLYEQDTRNHGGGDAGTFRTTGLVPTFIDRLREYGIELPRNYFG